MLDKWKSEFDKSVKLEQKKGKYIAFVSTIPLTLQMIYPLLIIIFGIYIIQNADLSLGTIVAFSSLGASFLTPLISLTSSYNDLLVVKLYISKLIDILDSHSEDNSDLLELNSLESGNIELNEVSFKYDKFSKNVLNDVNLSLGEGEKIAIVGSSGSGKSTLIKLLAGLHSPSTGTIKISGQNLKYYSKSTYRRQIGIVMQDSVLFSGSIRENITMGRSFSDQEILEAASKVNLLELLQKFPLGLSTLVSENGQNFSGGQRQRLSICRAVIGNPRLLLFDEPTSSLDNISERIIMENIFDEKTTVVVVAHRLSYINRFDKIILIKNGMIEDVGSHEELLCRNFVYKELIGEEDKHAK